MEICNPAAWRRICNPPRAKRQLLIALSLIAALLPLALFSCGPTPTPESTPGLSTLTPTPESTPGLSTLTSTPTLPQPGGGREGGADTISLLDPANAQITLWHPFTGAEGQALLELTSGFNGQNEWGITIKPEYGGPYRDLHEKTLAAIAFGSPPEMTFTCHSRVAEYAQADVIQPLDDYVASEKYGLTPEELQDYFPAFLAGDRYPAFDDQLLSLPPGLGMEVMYYNVDILKGLGYENPPATWDEFKAMCMDATRDTDGDGLNDTFGYAVSPSSSTFAGWVWSRGGQLLSKDGQKVLFQEQGLEALTLLKDLMDGGYAYQAVFEDGDRTDFRQGKVLFIFDSLDGLRPDAAAAEGGTAIEPEFEWSIAPFPLSPPVGGGTGGAAQPVVGLYGPTLCVFKTTPQKQLAGWLFIKWLTEPEQAARWAMAVGHFPVRKSAVETEMMKAYFEENPLYEKALGFPSTSPSTGSGHRLEYARVEPATASWREIQDVLSKAIAGVASGLMSPEEAMYEAMQEAEGVLVE